MYTATILFENIPLQYSEHVTHLDHILSSNLNDILQVVKDMNRKASTVLCIFGSADPFVFVLPIFVWVHIMVFVTLHQNH